MLTQKVCFIEEKDFFQLCNHVYEQVVHHNDEGVDPFHGVCDHDANIGDENSGACVLHEANGSGKFDIAQDHVEEGGSKSYGIKLEHTP